MSEEEVRQTWWLGVLMYVAAALCLGGAALGITSDLLFQSLRAAVIALTVVGVGAFLRYAIANRRPWRRRGGLLLSFLPFGLLGALIILGTDRQITFSRDRLHCQDGVDFQLAGGGKELVLSWKNAGINTYCEVEGPIRAEGVQTVMIDILVLDRRGAHPSMKVDVGGKHLPLVNPTDWNPALGDAPWVFLRAGQVRFVVPENVVQDGYISKLLLTFHEMREGRLHLTVSLSSSTVASLVSRTNLTAVVGIGALSGSALVLLLMSLTRKRKKPVDRRPENASARDKARE
ncbi:MAG: hypothetical protein AAB403_15735 [Planctomycetota bacterium]